MGPSEHVRRGEFPVRGAMSKAIEALHKGRGIWRADLRSFLGPELRRRWHVPGDADPELVRVIVVARLAAVLAEFGDPGLAEVFWAAFNVGLTQDAESRTLRGRFARLGAGRTKCDDQRELFTARIAESVRRPQRPLESAQLAAARVLLAGEKAAPRRGELSAVEAFVDLPRYVLSRFPQERLRVPLLGDGPLVASLGPDCEWYCVFTDDWTLERYRGVVGDRWSGIRHWSGRELATAAVRRGKPTGVLVNPSAVPGSGTERTVSLPPAVLRTMSGS
ncbi:hypothetical protein [Amycolatopsis panacis]|nr:hypothetical protein [Amycolatopsis panacis]